MSLRYVVVCTVSFATAFGCLSLTMQLLLFRKNHARLACSVVNALTTAHCRYQLLRIADRGEPCPYGMILNSILISTVSCYIFADFHGGSKPPPYIIGYIIQFVLTPHLRGGGTSRIISYFHIYKIQSIKTPAVFMTNRSNRYTDNRFRQCSLFCPEDCRPKANRTCPQPLRDCNPAQP